MGRIAIIGVGAIGGVVAAALESTGQHEIILCTRRPMNELVVKTPDGVVAARLANLVDPEGAATVVDWVFVATKVYDVASAASWFPRLCGPGTPVAIIQNGVEHVENYSPYSSKVEMMLEDDFVSALWKKLCLNAAGAVCALLAKPSGALRDEAIGEIVLDIIAEGMAVARAEGARLDAGLGPQILARFRAAPPDSINSILGDRLAGRPMEFDARNGVIVRKGALHGIKTPVNKMVVALLKGMAANSSGA